MAHNRPHLPLRAFLAVLSLAAAAPAGGDGILARPPAIEANPGRRKHKPPSRLRGLLARWLPWKVLEARGWRRDRLGNPLNPKREERRVYAALYRAENGRTLSGRQRVRYQKGR